MSETKLTARLSDGTDWEVVERCNTPFDIKTNQILDGYDRVLLKPLKPSPPEEVFFTVHEKTGEIFSWALDRGTARGLSGGRDPIRYILAPEPEPDKKPAREWWIIRNRFTGVTLKARDSEMGAVSFVESHTVLEAKDFEVVHVREVVPE